MRGILYLTANASMYLTPIVDAIKLACTPKSLRPITGYADYFLHKSGLEVGGPSKLFKKQLPLYKCIAHLDGCNFSMHTVWEGQILEGNHYRYYPNKTGYQYISEASHLEKIGSETYDFVLSCHCLEHCANPIKTVEEWCRVVKKGGYLLIVVPHPEFTFDHNRPITGFNHLLEDYRNQVGEDDLTHLNEIIEKHDLKMDIPAGTKESFTERSRNNFQNRCLHQHVFDFSLLAEIFDFLQIEIIRKDFIKPYHQVILGRKK
ncbi:MAG: methyltransferase domain-containing protein [Bacteroidota bacterium]|nr:methyltransferase domain-containing protein [Bacteroidota bacterium]